MQFVDLTELGGVAIDSTARRVTMPGEVYVPGVRITQAMFDVPPPMGLIQRKPWETVPEDLHGRTVGRMTVVGYFGRKPKASGAESQVWVARCPCGMYVTRTAKTIKRAKDPDDKCVVCRHVAYVKKVDRHQQTGKWDGP